MKNIWLCNYFQSNRIFEHLRLQIVQTRSSVKICSALKILRAKKLLPLVDFE